MKNKGNNKLDKKDLFLALGFAASACAAACMITAVEKIKAQIAIRKAAGQNMADNVGTPDMFEDEE